MNNSIKEGTLIRGTQLNRDLLPAFAIEFNRVKPEAFDSWARSTSKPWWLIDLARGKLSQPNIAPDNAWWHTEAADDLRQQLLTCLESWAPKGMRFGSHEGDDSDYGWWRVDNSIKPGRLCGTDTNSEMIPAFANELNRVSPVRFVQWSSGKACPTWLADAVQLESSEWLPPEHVWWSCELADRICRQLEKELDGIAPIGMGFGLIECPTGQAYGWYHRFETQKPDEGLAGGGTFRRVPVCQNCESPDLVAEEVRSRWNVATQAWEMFELGESFICQVCGHESEAFDWASADKELSPDELFERYGDAGHPEHTNGDWIQAVASGRTLLGYWSWVQDKINSEV